MATQTVNISLSSLRTQAVRTINVFAKRYAVQGENKFTFVALSSEEEYLLGDFILKAVHDIASHLAQLLNTYVSPDTVTGENETPVDVPFSAKFIVENSRWTDAEKAAFKDTVSDYCVFSAVGDYFALYFPSQSQHFLVRANEIMANILRLTYIKKEVSGSDSYFDSIVGGDTSQSTPSTGDDDQSEPAPGGLTPNPRE